MFSDAFLEIQCQGRGIYEWLKRKKAAPDWLDTKHSVDVGFAFIHVVNRPSAVSAWRLPK
ncbi:Hypothetical protein, conserved [Brucella suis ATCC 23445]|uniref:Uncharacterized protein n=1 Tax=Brucella suis (strain ATCC 23445 / NCTC 10510) TaxID=470137 RepID=A9WYD5_BRUSI|nr:Hypothetical protein, conserved [Brucella suis ATCC 23445]